MGREGEANTVASIITERGQFTDAHSRLLDPGTFVCPGYGNHCNFGKSQLVVCKGKRISFRSCVPVLTGPNSIKKLR